MRKFEHKLYEAYDGNGLGSSSSSEYLDDIFENSIKKHAKDLQYKNKIAKELEGFKTVVIERLKSNLSDTAYVQAHFTIYDDYVEFTDYCMYIKDFEAISEALGGKYLIFRSDKHTVHIYRYHTYQGFSFLKKVFIRVHYTLAKISLFLREN